MKKENLTPIKRNDTCIVCGAKFEPRKDKLYCSDTCKQKAYNDRKQKEEMEGIGNNSNCLTNEAKQNILYTFYFKEYELVKETAKNIEGFKLAQNLTLEEYCFFRKNLSGEVSIDFIIEYIDNFDQEDLIDNNRKLKKKYDDFLDIYHSRSITLNELPEYLRDVTENS
ncbi:MAG TPA: hypothetical protein DCG75_16065 [Bacteroidales bacterium]|nr:hypothetical protein [Bacteroidales bacterium]